MAIYVHCQTHVLKLWVAVWQSGGVFCITLASKLNEEKKRMIEKEMATTCLSVTP